MKIGQEFWDIQYIYSLFRTSMGEDMRQYAYNTGTQANINKIKFQCISVKYLIM